jgi:hypothetical protein
LVLNPNHFQEPPPLLLFGLISKPVPQTLRVRVPSPT